MPNVKKNTLVTAQLVKLDDPISSRFQANFLQVFPSNYDDLPAEHKMDQECFEKYYKGEEEITFKEFRKKYYERQIAEKS